MTKSWGVWGYLWSTWVLRSDFLKKNYSWTKAKGHLRVSELCYDWKTWLSENLSVISHTFGFIMNQVMDSPGGAARLSPNWAWKPGSTGTLLSSWHGQVTLWLLSHVIANIVTTKWWVRCVDMGCEFLGLFFEILMHSKSNMITEASSIWANLGSPIET